MRRLGLVEPSSSAHGIWLWRRVLHPDKPMGQGGPEIDFGISTKTTLILGESKWGSKVGKNQGVNHDKDQIQLRRELFETFGPALYPSVRTFVVLGVGLTTDVAYGAASEVNGRSILMRNLMWSELCEFSDHPVASEMTASYKFGEIEVFRTESVLDSLS